MLERARGWLTAPVFEGDEDRTGVAAMLNTLILIMLGVVVVFVAANVVFAQAITPSVITIAATFAIASGACLVLLRRGDVRFAGVLSAGVLWAGFTLRALEFGGTHDPALGGYFVVILLAGIAGGGAALFGFSLACAASAIAIFAAEHLNLVEVSIPNPSAPNDLILLVLLLGTAAALLWYALRRIEKAYDRARRSAQALGESNVELEASRDLLATQRAELERRSRYLQTAADVAREAASVLELEQLLPEVVDLIADRFNLYRIGLFLLDARKEWATLEAAAGEGATRLQGQVFRIATGGGGTVAHVVRTGRVHVAPDVSQDALYLPFEAVADTRSELALPLRARGEVLGALSVQSPHLDAFGEQDVSVMQNLADQVALAISNAQLFQRTQESTEAERRAYGELSREGWRELVRAQADLAVLRDASGISRLPTWVDDEEVERVLETGRSAASPDGAMNLAVPIRLRGGEGARGVIGVIDAHKREGARGWTAEQIATIEAIADQLAGALESARLHHDTQRRAAREQLIGDVTARMRETLDMDTVLRTAIREIGLSLDLAEVEVRMATDRGVRRPVPDAAAPDAAVPDAAKDEPAERAS